MSSFVSLDKIDLKKADPGNMLSCIEGFPDLIKRAFAAVEEISIPSYYIKINKVVLLGMGGSGAALEILRDLLLVHTKLPVEVCHDYDLPGFVDQDTLVIASSYSGNTEETLSAFISAHEKGAKLMAITKGGKLKILSAKYKAPIFLIDYDSQPRAAFPFLFIYVFAIFSKLGFLPVTGKTIDSAIVLLEKMKQKFLLSTSVFSNPAKILAQKIFEKCIIIYSTPVLSGAAKRFKNQINENAKNFAFTELFPELNHNSILGYQLPKRDHVVISLESNFESERNVLRQSLTKEILVKNKIACERIKFEEAKNPFIEVLLHVMFGDFVSYYLAILNKVDPSKNDAIDSLKSKLVSR